MAKIGKWSIENKQPPKGETNSLEEIGDLLKDKNLEDFKKPKKNESKTSEPKPKKSESVPEKGSTRLANKLDNAIAKSHSRVEDWVKIDEIAEILKNDKISQIVIHAKENIEPEDAEAGLTFKHDLDSRLALYLLNDFNKRTPEETYTEGAISSVVIKGGADKNLRDKKEGLVVWIDVGGRWLEVQKDKENNKNKKIFIDHHGKAKNLQTSASEMTYEILKRAGLLKEHRKWMENLVKLTTDVDNLLYLGEKDTEGKRIFNTEYFKKEWPRSLKGLAEDIPFEILIELFKSGKIKDPSKIFTEEELKGEFGQISWKVGEKTKSITELCQEKRHAAEATIFALTNNVNHAKFLGLTTRNTKIGDIIYHNFHQIGSREKPRPNTVPFRTAYIGTRAMGYDSFVLWNEKRREFFINSKHPGLSDAVKKLEKKAPGTTNIRSAMIFSPKNKKSFENLNEKDFLDLIDPNITEKSKIKSPEDAASAIPPAKTPEIKTNLDELEEKRISILEKIEDIEKEIAKLESEINTLGDEEETFKK